MVKNLPATAGDIRDEGSIPGLGRSPAVGNGIPLQYCLENSMDRGAWRVIVHGILEYLSFCVWLTALSIMFSGFIYVVAGVSISSLLIAE